ncbi:MAG: extracellular solute-binding protein [Patescibacteria group bacterium]|nr:extracellular solute-binding protein [Patescibacteria group bacterium]
MISRKYIILGIIVLAILVPIFIGIFLKEEVKIPKSVTLKYWIVEGSEKDYQDIVSAFKNYHPYVKVSFRKVKLEEYEDTLIQAWARDQGPDIFELPSTWLKKYQEFITPAPAEITTAYYENKKEFFRNTVEIKYRTKSSPTLDNIKNNYVDIIYDDVVLSNNRGKRQIYALPYSIDTLAVYYNKDLLNNAYIAQPAKTWNELVQQSSKLSLYDNQNNILQSSIALGLSSNIEYHYGILSLLMIQNGVSMISPSGEEVSFNRSRETTNLGALALDFYTSFTNINKETYSWNSSQPESLDNFTSGKSAYYIGTLADKSVIDKTANLNYGVTEMFHINPSGTDRVLNKAGNPVQVNFGKYWVHTVAKKTKSLQEAWDLVQFIAREKRNRQYLEKTGKISPLRSILNIQKEDPDLGLWARQALTAKNWYTGYDASATKNYFAEMIETVALKNKSSSQALNEAAEKIERTLE